MVWWVNRPPVALTCLMGASVSPGAPFLSQLPANTPVEAAEDLPSPGPVIHMGYIDKAPGFGLVQPWLL